MLLCVQAGVLAWALNAAVIDGRSVAELWPAALAYALLALLRFGLSLVGRRCGFEAGAGVVAGVRSRLVERLARLSPGGAAEGSTAQAITRVVDGADALGPYVARYLPQKAAAAILPLVILAAVFPADWVGGVVLLVSAPLVPIFMLLLGGAAERASQRRWLTLTRLGTQFFDTIQGLVTLRLFGAGARRRAVLAERSEAYRRETMAVLRVAFLSSLVLEFFATVSIAVVAVLIGFRLMWGELDFLRGMFVLLLAPEFFLPLRAMGALRHARMDALSVAGELAAVLPGPGDGVTTPASATVAQMPTRPPRIELDDLRFAYPNGRLALDGITGVFEPGSMTALVGASGSGKSSLLRLLMGFEVADGGLIRADGRDLRDWELADWRRHIAWIPQQPHLFVGSVRDNVLMARPDADETDLNEAAAIAGLDAVLATLPQGWDTPLGENGYGLSGGQAQRVALARAFLRDAPVLLLDEPVQHLDVASAEAFRRALRRLSAGRTVILVAHRLASVRDADAVWVMERGRVCERGTPAELHEGHGAFARLLAAEDAA